MRCSAVAEGGAPGTPIARAGLAALLLALAVGVQAAQRPANPAVGAGLVCISGAGLVCLDAADLSPRWRALEGAHTLEPVIADGVVLVGGGAGLHAFAAADGRPLWQWRGQGLVFSPMVAGGTAYAADRHGRLRALDLATGAPRWQRRLDGWSYPPALVGGRLVTGGQAGVVRALDPADGRTLWRRDAGQELVYRPVAAGGRAVLTTFAGRVLAYEPDGTLAWAARDPVPSFSPAVAGPLLLFGGMDGHLRARRVDDGAAAWELVAAGQLAVPARYHAASAQAALIDGDDRALVVDAPAGRLLVRQSVPGRGLGSPVYRSGTGWIVFSRHDGTIAHHRVSEP
ncbi:MAG: PQQ-binding-like beta-propeller repeat protein [Halofilum sp. (in: g-proteobacteria)]|nr:PQQ-binding-like beta-propeller repeat protein [Halofilum sp. (in: g-proteobacteria)]